MRPANGVVLALALSAGCAVLPGQIHVLADADGPEARQDAVAEAIRWLGDRRRPVALRSSAARALGRLRSAEPASVSALAAVLEQRYEPRELRCFAAWALGELRSPDSLAALTSALRTGLSEPVAAYVFEALAKHAAVMAGDESVCSIRSKPSSFTPAIIRACCLRCTSCWTTEIGPWPSTSAYSSAR